MSATTVTRDKAGERRPRFIVRMVVMLVIVGLLAAGLIGFHRFKSGILKQVVAGIVAQVPTVATGTAHVLPWQPHTQAPGSLRASAGTDIAAEVNGIVDDLPLKSGDDVAAGTVLMRLRPNDDEAKLAQLQATADLDATTLQRDQRQYAAQGVAQATVDTDAGNLRVARAAIAAQQALMAQKIVRAPFAGRLGLRLVDRGQYLAAGATIVTLQALDPILVDFYLPQQAVGQVTAGLAVNVRVDALPGRDFPGTVEALNSKADGTSRMLQVRASLPNPGRILLPGMFATVEVATAKPTPQVTVPLAALTYAPYGSSVYVVVPDGADAQGAPRMVVHQRFVTPGEQRGDQVTIVKGVADGDRVVTAGQMKLREGLAIKIDDSVQPTSDASPTPADR